MTTAVTADAATDSPFAQQLEHVLPNQFAALETVISAEVASLLADHLSTAGAPKNADKSMPTVLITTTDVADVCVKVVWNGVKETEDASPESIVQLLRLTTDVDLVSATAPTLCTVPTPTNA